MAYLPQPIGISDSIGNNLTNNPEDIWNTKRAFASVGRYNKPVENGYIDGELVKAIQTFQKDRNLRRDGIMHPGGETETTLHDEIKQREKTSAASSDIKLASAVPAAGEALWWLGAPTIAVVSEWLKNKGKTDSTNTGTTDGASTPTTPAPDPSSNEKPHCEDQYNQDMSDCKKAGKDHGPRAFAGCKSCAMERYGECRADKPLRPLQYWTGGD